MSLSDAFLSLCMFCRQRFGNNVLQKPWGIKEMFSAEAERFRNLARSNSGSEYWQSLLLMPCMKEMTIEIDFPQACGDLATPCSICDEILLTLEPYLDLLRISLSVCLSISFICYIFF